jgi:hypothetical protein
MSSAKFIKSDGSLHGYFSEIRFPIRLIYNIQVLDVEEYYWNSKTFLRVKISINQRENNFGYISDIVYIDKTEYKPDEDMRKINRNISDSIKVGDLLKIKNRESRYNEPYPDKCSNNIILENNDYYRVLNSDNFLTTIVLDKIDDKFLCLIVTENAGMYIGSLRIEFIEGVYD